MVYSTGFLKKHLSRITAAINVVDPGVLLFVLIRVGGPFRFLSLSISGATGMGYDAASNC
jgi:hypothetical protein